MHALAVFLLMIELVEIRGPKDFDYRWQLAEAISEGTEDPDERRVLARLGFYEGGYRRAVARCEIKGDGGKSVGAFQVQPASPKDAKMACGTLSEQVDVAIRYLRRAADACPQNEGFMRLAVYVSGRCDRGQKAAKERWGIDAR